MTGRHRHRRTRAATAYRLCLLTTAALTLFAVALLVTGQHVWAGVAGYIAAAAAAAAIAASHSGRRASTR
ncbi:hypothetical protein [Skermania piniformis]|uniref:Uncharacterized protein n=1 Tax=Skermania pinensis TaxID=39122 RepID=A0ABX8SC14_9ACTN|nr:hypothetical protein [Skermania piniformis]QXQ14856.1 hypothetical protein KV203_05595 [Skermania piniformis]